MQMLWWGIDETLAELFARHPSADNFEGNPMDVFWGVIDGRAYGLNQMPRSLGLYGSAQVSLCERALRLVWGGMLTAVCAPTGTDFMYRKNFNNLLEVEWMGGDSEMTEEEYTEERYRRDQLRPETGGRHFRAQLGGAGYERREGRLY
jgi:hypothetical protein